VTSAAASIADPSGDRVRAYPISRWYVIPITSRVASWLKPTRVRPNHLTLLGLLFGLFAIGLLLVIPTAGPVAAALILVAWFMDRTDGTLARDQNTASPFGSWLDANVDEFHDVAWHTATAYAAASLTGSQLPWFLLVGFLAGKYLFMNGLAEERALSPPSHAGQGRTPGAGLAHWVRTAYHLPGNADVRLHLLVVALLLGLPMVELAVVAAYYNFRWIVRIGLTARRLEGCR
jgi:phosphatidylglycerophosphate synthase